MDFQHSRRGSGPPLLLVHGLGNTRRLWSLVERPLEERREVIAIDLPGHGATPAEADSGTFAGLARSLEQWLKAQKLDGVDMAGSSLGGRLVLEMARRGLTGAVVALDPGGFWRGWERRYVYGSLTASAALLRSVSRALPALAHNVVARSALLAQLSARPWALDGDLMERELASLAATPTFSALVSDLCFGPPQEGPAAPGSGPVTIGWGRHDRLTLPAQARRAVAAFPGARLHWFDHSGHFPMLDEPDAAAALILEATGTSAAQNRGP
jgi:pimeloyl-ACP methyl ester carboxylesterase